MKNILRGRIGTFPFITASSVLFFDTEEEATRYRARLVALYENKGFGKIEIETLSLEQLEAEHQPPELYEYERYLKEQVIKSQEEEALRVALTALIAEKELSHELASKILTTVRQQTPKLLN